ncbi:MAG: hypothetical protein COW03_06095 [Cytophagales bacterium CG12_big_fil_rev_8_21_14_0_65_40_12]|nr:MAG: hypothetical protein COW03_06095 [Cytophagales bacterium CG12_big_fil_rev_8_21_14_0_65_40_12]PIW03641.1 MAG: hypothetical protein COW40_13975 [Cytophagales bacterium CG17_big_fil_post_rev_8_21_14_2_50_40_13]
MFFVEKQQLIIAAAIQTAPPFLKGAGGFVIAYSNLYSFLLSQSPTPLSKGEAVTDGFTSKSSI